MSDADVRARVLAFIADFSEAWDLARTEEAIRANPRGAMGAWRAELAGVAAMHCAAKVKTGDERTLMPWPAHDPAAETITSLEVDGDRAMVRSSVDREFASLYKHYEYELGRFDGDWLITRIRRFVNAAGVPLVDAAERARLLGMGGDDASTKAPHDAATDLNHLFDPDRLLQLYGESVSTQIVHVGVVTTRSGVLLVRDVGHASMWLVPLSRRITPGTYPIQVARASDRNVALRLLFSEDEVAEWRTAERADGTGHFVAVDYRNIAVLDLVSLLECDTRTVERLVSDVFDGLLESAAMLLSFGEVPGTPVVAAASSGWGDGEYPVYWGLSERGDPVVLLVDFLLVADPEGADDSSVRS